MGGAKSLRCSTSQNAAESGPARCCTLPSSPHRASDAFRNRRQRPRAKRPAGCRCSRSARQNPRQRGLLTVAAAEALPLVRRRAQADRGDAFTQGIGPRPRACTGKERTSMAVPIRWFGSTPGGCATSCASSTTADPIRSSSRCRKAATCPSSNPGPPQSPTRLVRLLSQSCKRVVRFGISAARDCRRRSCCRRRDGRWRGDAGAHPAGPRRLHLSYVPWPRIQEWRDRLRCPRTATSSPSPGRAVPTTVRRISTSRPLGLKRFGG